MGIMCWSDFYPKASESTRFSYSHQTITSQKCRKFHSFHSVPQTIHMLAMETDIFDIPHLAFAPYTNLWMFFLFEWARIKSLGYYLQHTLRHTHKAQIEHTTELNIGINGSMKPQMFQRTTHLKIHFPVPIH